MIFIRKYFIKSMTNNKNVVEEALIQIRNLEETLQENAKGILQSTMSEEIRQLVKESLKEQEDEEVSDEDMEMDDEETAVDDEDMTMDDEVEVDDEDMEMDDEEMDMDDDEMSMDDEETIDMTGASDQEVLRVFKAMGDEDGIIVKKDGENIRLTDGDNDYMIQLGESEEDMMETMYEIEMDEEDDDMEDMGEMMEYDMMSNELDEWNWTGAATGAVMGGLGLREDDMEDEVVYEIEMDEEDDMSIHDMEVYEMDDMEMMEMDDMEMMEMDDEMMESNWGGNKHDYKRRDGRKMGDVDGHYKDYEMMEMDDEMMEMDDMEMMEMDDEMMEMDDYMMESKKSMKSKGLESRRGPKFNYDKKPNMSGGFNTKRKEAFGKGTKAMGTGKAKFEYKEGENMEKGSMKKVETKEASRTYGNGSKNGSRGLRKARLNNRNMEFNPFKLSESSINEVNLLREKNEEYKQALDVFRTKLNEVAVFNSNLAYATRLFTEHSTTKQEKINILKRFDNVESLKESKNLYRSIKTELNSGSNVENKINESIERTVKTVSTGSAVNLIESKTYENPQFMRMKDLMTKLK
jgi:hypothetical protein